MNLKELETLKEEVKNLHGRILAECQKNEKLKALYKGCQIFYSPFRINVDVLFVGLNPGGGYAKANEGQIVENFEPMEKYELNILAEEVRMCFRDAGKENIFDNAVATNGRFFATDGSEELKSFLAKLPENLRNEVKTMSIKWIRTLIEIVKPKIIMCLGNESFDYLHHNVYGSEMVVTEDKNPPLEAKIGNILVIGCQRRGSTIIKKDPLIERLREYMKVTSIVL
jgi:hypothetical protein